jgi:hypothetical protein
MKDDVITGSNVPQPRDDDISRCQITLRFYLRNKISLSDANPFSFSTFSPVLHHTKIVCFIGRHFRFQTLRKSFTEFFLNRPWGGGGGGKGLLMFVYHSSIQSGALRGQPACLPAG